MCNIEQKHQERQQSLLLMARQGNAVWLGRTQHTVSKKCKRYTRSQRRFKKYLTSMLMPQGLLDAFLHGQEAGRPCRAGGTAPGSHALTVIAANRQCNDVHHVTTDRFSDFKLDEKGALALCGWGGGCDTLALQLSGGPSGREAGQRQSLRACPQLGRAAGRIVPPQVCIHRPSGAQHKAGLRAQPGRTPSRGAGRARQAVSQHPVKCFDNSPAETRQCQVVFTAVCSVSRYFTNPVVFGLKRKEGNQKPNPEHA